MNDEPVQESETEDQMNDNERTELEVSDIAPRNDRHGKDSMEEEESEPDEATVDTPGCAHTAEPTATQVAEQIREARKRTAQEEGTSAPVADVNETQSVPSS